MTFDSAYIKQLVDAYIKGGLDRAGQQALEQWLRQSSCNMDWFEAITSEPGLTDAFQHYNSYNTPKMLQKLCEGESLQPMPLLQKRLQRS